MLIYIIIQQMQQENLKLDQENSDNDEGFIVNTVEIKEKQGFKAVIQSTARPTDYQARYISTNQLIKKQIQQLVSSYPHFARQDMPTNDYQANKKVKDGVMHPQQKYFNSKNYRLLYQRNSKRIERDDSYSQNDVPLSSVVNYSSDNYSIIKSWEIREENQQLVFQSRFQSGNLALVYKNLIEVNTYALFLQNDTNTKGYNKWFYFAVKNTKKNVAYTFSIVNFRKYFGFFKQGLKVIKFSQKDHRSTGNGWSRCDKNIQFYRSQLSNSNNPDQNAYYTLSFDVSFDHEGDLTFFSLLPPYSYTKLINFLQQAKESLKQREKFTIQLSTIAYSLGNTQVPYVTISSSDQSKKNIIILARQHPGEVWSSFLAESIIRQLIRDLNVQKDWLLKNYTFRIFPMINVDGVIYGNFRCDLSGMDLNRCWKSPNKLIHPHIIAIKQQIVRLASEQEIACCLDLHSHSKDYNIFAYCCKTDNEGRVLPYLLSKMTPLFHFPSCTFGVSKYKETTARATIYDLSRTNDVLTIQSSFFAFNNPFKMVHPSIFLTFANALLKSFQLYFSKNKEYMEAAEALPKAMAEVDELRNKNKDKLFNQQSGSDSEPQCDQIALTQKIGKILPKCSVVEVAFGMVKDGKQRINTKPKDPPLKKVPKKVQPKRAKQSRLFERSTIQIQSSRHKEDKTPLIPGRSLTIGHNQLPLQRILKKTERTKKQDKKQLLPSEPPQQVLHFANNRKNESLQFPSRNSLQKNFISSGFGDTIRDKGTSRYELQYKFQKREEQQFPLLCVLSQRKKEVHLQKLRMVHPSQRQRSIVCYQPTLIINKKLDMMDRLRESQKNSSELVASIWKRNLPPDNDLPPRSIFYGGI